MITTKEEQIPEQTALTVADEELNAMIKSGVHIGHASSKTNPKMARYIYTNRGGVAVFDLVKTKENLLKALEVIQRLAREKKTILFVGTKPAAKNILLALAGTYHVPVVTERWVGGTLTNSKVILGRVQELEQLLKEKAEGGFKKYTKKETAKKEEKIARLEKTFGGIKPLKRIPDAIFVADADEDDLALREAKRVNIPCIAIVNSSANPNDVTHCIPANDNSIQSVRYILQRVEEAVKEGQKEEKISND